MGLFGKKRDKVEELMKELAERCPSLPSPATQLSTIREKLKEDAEYQNPFTPGEVVTQKKGKRVYTFPYHGDPAVVISVGKVFDKPIEMGAPVTDEDMIIAVVANHTGVKHYAVNSRHFEMF